MNISQQNKYQLVGPSLALHQQQRDNRVHANASDDIVRKVSDAQYFESLMHYKPICYSGEGTPFFLKNEVWCQAYSCVIFLNFIFVVCLIMFLITGKGSQQIQNSHVHIRNYQPTKFPNDKSIILISSCVSLLVINVSYFFCQFMNPGIQNITTISQEQFEQKGKTFCQECNSYRTNDMVHCKECQVCVWGLDHHCGFFDKCIAGWQKWAFYVFLSSIFCAFLLIIICLGMILTFY